MRIDLMNKSKKQDFLKQVSYLGELKTNALFLSAGKEQIRIYTGGLHSDDIMKIWRHYPVEMVGLYFGKEFIDRHGNKESRVSLDGLHALKDQINGNVVEIDSVQNDLWFRGNNVELNQEQKARAGVSPDGQKKYKNMVGQFVAVKHGNDFVGTAKLNEQGILVSFLPKERRIKG